jgi:hypothetical protein
MNLKCWVLWGIVSLLASCGDNGVGSGEELSSSENSSLDASSESQNESSSSVSENSQGDSSDFYDFEKGTLPDVFSGDCGVDGQTPFNGDFSLHSAYDQSRSLCEMQVGNYDSIGFYFMVRNGYRDTLKVNSAVFGKTLNRFSSMYTYEKVTMPVAAGVVSWEFIRGEESGETFVRIDDIRLW